MKILIEELLYRSWFKTPWEDEDDDDEDEE